MVRHHADLKCAFTQEEEPPSIRLLDQEFLTQAVTLSQTEQVQQAKRERRLATFAHVHYTQWCACGA